MEASNFNSDMALAQQAAAGDESAWHEIYRATRERLFGLLVYHLGDREEALDVLQDTYLHALRGIGSYGGHGSLESWLVGIAIRRAKDWKRRLLGRLKRTVSMEEAPDPEDVAAGGDPEEARRLGRALGELPDRQRSAVLLHEWMGYSFEEVGEMLGISASTARVHAFRGRDALRARLRGEVVLEPTGERAIDSGGGARAGVQEKRS